MLENNYNTIEGKIKNKNMKEEEEKNFKKKLGFLSNTHQDFISKDEKSNDLTHLKNFPGFFNKNFNLTSFREKQESFRLKSRSPEKKIIQHQLKGNGIPNDIIERLKFMRDIFNSDRFKKFFKSLSKIKNIKFEDIIQKIEKYSVKYSQLEGIMLSYYFICHTIKYDYKFSESSVNYKKAQSIETVIKNKKGLSLGFTNLFEALMKKLEVKCKHIEGYCKLLPDRVKYLAFNTDTNSSFNDSNIKSKSKDKDNIIFPKNTSIVFTRYNDSSIINSKYLGVSKTLTKTNINDEDEDISDYINHCWNAFYYKGEWYLVDATLGSCWFDKNRVKRDLSNDDNDTEIQDDYKSDDTKFEFFNPFYFMAPPQYLIYTHLPGKVFWQLTDKFCTLKQFQHKKNIDFAQFYLGLYKYNMEYLSHPNPLIIHNIKDKLIITFKLLYHTIEGNIFDLSGTHKIGEVKYSIDRKKGITNLEPFFPKVGEYYIKLNICATSSNDIVYKPLFDYYIKVTNDISFNYFEKYIRMKQAKTERDKLENNLLLPKIKGFHSIDKNTKGKIISDYTKVFPSRNNKIICYDNEGFALLEPRTVYIRKGIITKFKVMIKGAQSVFILDGNKWMQLKKNEDNIFSGQKEIKNDNVSICCLKKQNVFTEVFRFKNRKKFIFEKSMGAGNRRKNLSLNK
jgi:hypothetical protein